MYESPEGMADYTLCQKLYVATLAPTSVRDSWAHELQRRSVDCSQYAGMIGASQQQQNATIQQSIDLMNSSRQPQVAPSAAPAYFKYQYTSGVNRICVYDRRGSEYAVTYSVSQVCPARLD